MNTGFNILADIIRSRRTIKPAAMNGQAIPDEQVRALLSLADWAPTHGHTEPWRFFVYAGDRVTGFCREHAGLYRRHTPEEKFTAASYEKLLHMGDQASHVIIAAMQRGSLPKIPALEEIAATAAAIQNLLLGAAALGIAAYWGSGGMILRPEMKTWLHLHEEDTILGAIYLGYTDTPVKQGIRHISMEEKIRWM